MPNLHITLGADSLKLDDVADLNFSPELFQLLTAFVYVATGAQDNPQQAEIDSAVEQMRESRLTLQRVLDAHAARTT